MNYIRCYEYPHNITATPVWQKFSDYCWDNKLKRNDLLADWDGEVAVVRGVEYVVFKTDNDLTWFLLKWA